jgi:hypothetical protein
MLVESE